MKIKQIIPTLLISSSALMTTCSHKAPQVQDTVNQLAKDVKLQTILTDTFSRKMSDKTKIIEFNKLLKKYNNNVDNYIIVDKKKCTATVLNPDGDVLQVSEVALGRDIGDKRGGGYGVKGAVLRAYTPPGEFDVIRVGTRDKKSKDYWLYGDRVMPLAGEHTQKKFQKSQVLALHRVPSSPMGKLRENVFNNKTLKDNRVSFGCVNFLVDSFDKMKSLIKGAKTKVYILPEEKGNSLHLEKQKDGSYKFFQTKYRHEWQEPKPKRVILPKIDSTKIAKTDTVKTDSVKLDSLAINPVKSEQIKTDSVVSPDTLIIK